MNTLSQIASTIQQYLFPMQEDILGKMTDKHRLFVKIIELSKIGAFISPTCRGAKGRPEHSRLCIAYAFVAKAVWNCNTTRCLIDRIESDPQLRRLCGWESCSDIPSESTFSRAFDEFAQAELPGRIHEAMVTEHCAKKLVGHISRDSTPIDGREKANKKGREKVKSKRKRGRPKKGEQVEPKPERRVVLQLKRSLAENVKDLPRPCDYGTKRDSKGYKKTWLGFKLHVDCADGDIPISAILTSASVHDSQVAIPLAQMSFNRVDSCYDLMDAAYDVPEIREHSRRLNHVPLIDHNKRRGEKILFAPHEKVRYRERSTAERVMSNIKDNFGGRFVRVRSAAKVMCHLMFGILAMTAKQLFKQIE